MTKPSHLRTTDGSVRSPSIAFAPGYMLAVMTLANAINWADRQVVAILLPLIRAEFTMTDTQLGLLSGFAFAMIYAVSSFVFGRAADFRIRRSIVAFGLFLWSLATIASGMAIGFVSLFAARFFTGVGESSLYPSSMSLISDKYPGQGRGRAMGIFGSAAAIGGGLGIYLGGPIAEAWGWRTVFYIYGAVGIALIPLVMSIGEAPRAEPERREPVREVISGLIRDKRLVALWLSGMVMMASAFGYATWLPSFLTRVHGLTLSEAGALYGTAAILGGLVGSLAGGFAADRGRARRTAGELDVAMWAGLVSAPLAYIAVTAQDPFVFRLFAVLAPIAIYAYFPPLQVLLVGIVAPRQLGLAYAINIVFMGGIGPSVGPYVVGAISDATGSLATALLAPVGGMIISSLLIAYAGRLVRADESSPAVVPAQR